MQKASLAFINARVVTLNAAKRYCRAVAIDGNRIIAIGSNEEIRRFVDSRTKVIDAEDGTLVPGLVDCHAHMTGLGFLLQYLDLRSNVGSIKGMLTKLREYSRGNPSVNWIEGGRWDEERFAEKRLPTRWDLDEVIDDRPVLLKRVCGHIGVVNSKALQLAGITKSNVVMGGKIDLDNETGEPTGILRENALALVSRLIPKPGLSQLENACMHATRKAVEAGLTCVHWMVESADEISTLRKLDSDGKIPLRVRLGVSIELMEMLQNSELVRDNDGGMVKMGFFKILADGSLGAHTAALRSDYSDTKTLGILLYRQSTLEDLVLKVHKAGFQLATHAIGDRAIEKVLQAHEKALRAFPRANHRHRIEHSSVLSTNLIKRMKRLGMIASVQPAFVVSDSWIQSRIGKKRARWVYPFKSLLKKGLIVASGSDCPVEDLSPIIGMWAAATQNTRRERLTATEALTTYTTNAAFSSFQEDKLGSIKVGSLADLTLLSKSIRSVCSKQVKSVCIKMTIVDGEIVYWNKALP